MQPLALTLHAQQHAAPPAHHVVSRSALLPHWRAVPVATSGPSDAQDGPGEASGSSSSSGSGGSSSLVRTGFRNPWPSWHTPTLRELWDGLSWRTDASAQSSSASAQGASGTAEDDQEKAAELAPLQVLAPDFQAPSAQQQGRAPRVGATWLGHAGVLLQLPSLRRAKASGVPESVEDDCVRLVCDPIFSDRCSPSQFFGPLRSYPAPCEPAALPPVHGVLISHSHYDHLDVASLSALWTANAAHLRFFVPLGLRAWFGELGLGIPAERVTELDWWDEVRLYAPDVDKGDADVPYLRIVCTPAQHGSGRCGLDAGVSLWSSWYMQHVPRAAAPGAPERFSVFFGGDTGFQFHGAQEEEEDAAAAADTAATPLLPSRSTAYPICPLFAQVRRRLGVPDLLLLPISVGATLSFLKSYEPPLPAALKLFPSISDGLTGANHMGPRDAVRAMRIMIGAAHGEPDDQEVDDAAGVPDDWRPLDDAASPAARAPRAPLALAVHWGTFVGDAAEAAASMRQLREACAASQTVASAASSSGGVRFCRGAAQTQAWLGRRGEQKDDQAGDAGAFAALDHGETVWL